LGIAGEKQRRQGDDGEEFVHGDGVYLVYHIWLSLWEIEHE